MSSPPDRLVYATIVTSLPTISMEGDFTRGSTGEPLGQRSRTLTETVEGTLQGFYAEQWPRNRRWMGGGEYRRILTPSTTGNQQSVLRTRVDRLEQRTHSELQAMRLQLAAIETAIQNLPARFAEKDTVPHFLADALSAPTAEDLVSLLGSDFLNSSWAELFEIVADNYDIGTPAVAECAVASIRSKDARNRAAAARALAAIHPAAADIIETALSSEENAAVRSIMEGAIEAARL